MRGFAAATVVGVAAAILAATALVVAVVSTLEASGSLVGRSSVALTDLPYGLTKPEQIRTLTAIAAKADVSLAMLVPDRDARADTWTAYVFRGQPIRPALRGELDVRPVGSGDDLDLRTTFAIGGSAGSTTHFLEGLGRAGYRFADVSPHHSQALRAAIAEPSTLAALVATALGTVVALVAESARRKPRQEIRRTVGWSRRRIAAREASEMGALVGALVVIACLAIALLLSTRHASALVWQLSFVLMASAVLPVAAGLIGVHTLCALFGTKPLVSVRRIRWHVVVVAAAGVGLVVTSVLDVRGIVHQRDASTALEGALIAEAAHGDDVVLGTGFTDFDQDVALGMLALGPLARGDASMAQVSFVDTFTVVGDAATGLGADADAIAEARSRPVLLVPRVLADDAQELRRAAEEDLAVGWEVEGKQPPREAPVRGVTVPSTAHITQAVLDWTGALEPEAPTWPDIPVLVVPDPADIAPNRIGTAVANGEVRFADREAILGSVRAAGLADVVLQVRRVGATVEGRLAALRSERVTAGIAALAAAVAIVFTAYALVVAHRVRTRLHGQVLDLAGRHPAVRHRRFFAAGVGGAAATAAVTASVAEHSAALALLVAASAGGLAALMLIVLLTLTGRREGNRP